MVWQRHCSVLCLRQRNTNQADAALSRVWSGNPNPKWMERFQRQADRGNRQKGRANGGGQDAWREQSRAENKDIHREVREDRRKRKRKREHHMCSNMQFKDPSAKTKQKHSQHVDGCYGRIFSAGLGLEWLEWQPSRAGSNVGVAGAGRRGMQRWFEIWREYVAEKLSFRDVILMLLMLCPSYVV